MEFFCPDCGARYPFGELIWRCACGGALSLDWSPVYSAGEFDSGRMDMWRYAPAYPLSGEDIRASFGEGMTPLVGLPGSPLRLKLDSLMPSGSFKDRGCAMVVNYLLKFGAGRVCEDSSGNAGASVAMYSALAGPPCRVFVPQGNSAGKIVQARAYGAEVIEVPGDRAAVERAAQQDSSAYSGHNWHPLFVQGVKSLAYELWEQNGGEVPSDLICPGGNGSIPLGLYLGFSELRANGLSERLPRIFIVQADSVNPIYRARYPGREEGEYRPTLAEGIATKKPNRMSLILRALEESGGDVLCAGEDEIIPALRALGRSGFFVEPTSAVAYAGFARLAGEGRLGQSPVMIVTGNGLKASAKISELL